MSSDVLRDGEPVLKRGPAVGSVKRKLLFAVTFIIAGRGGLRSLLACLQHRLYEIRTTPLPGGAQGVDWRGYFNSRLTGGQFLAYHDGTKIVAECWPDDEPNLTEAVDAAIEYANKQVGTEPA